jgi:prepilin-type N-terminal cleavage/methylation domain-containing protein
MKKNKGFTMIEVIIVIAILAVILMIGIPALSGILKRSQIDADKRTAGQIAKSFLIASTFPTFDSTQILEHPEIKEYSIIEGIENYISKNLIPQSAPNGYYFVTRIANNLIVGITDGAVGSTTLNKIYNGEGSGIAYVDGMSVDKLIEKESAQLQELVIISPRQSGGGGTPSEGETGTKLASVATVGQYVNYTPSSTSYTVSTTDSGYTSGQTYNPSTITSWRVFSNDGTTVKLISTESVGDLRLTGATGYAKAVNTLNNLCAAYVNTTYATSGRSLGYKEGSSMEEINTGTYPLTWAKTYPKENLPENAFPYIDTYYTDDTTIINANSGALRHSSSGYIWLASRGMLSTSSNSFFYVCGISNSGGLNNYTNYLYISDSVGTEHNGSRVNGVRPVVSLQSVIEVSNGVGTSTSPYEITN